jgi:hypothetical protein
MCAEMGLWSLEMLDPTEKQDGFSGTPPGPAVRAVDAEFWEGWGWGSLRIYCILYEAKVCVAH